VFLSHLPEDIQSAPNPVNNKEFGEKLAKEMRRPSVFFVPSFFLKLFLGEASTLVLDGQRVIPKRLLEAGFKFNYENLDNTLKHLFNHN
jgi:uncharacterized protein